MKMLSEEERYRAYTFNFAGFALMTPFGRLVLENVKLFNDVGAGWFVFNCTISLFLFWAGLTFVEQGRRILNIRRKSNNE